MRRNFLFSATIAIVVIALAALFIYRAYVFEHSTTVFPETWEGVYIAEQDYKGNGLRLIIEREDTSQKIWHWVIKPELASGGFLDVNALANSLGIDREAALLDCYTVLNGSYWKLCKSLDYCPHTAAHPQNNIFEFQDNSDSPVNQQFVVLRTFRFERKEQRVIDLTIEHREAHANADPHKETWNFKKIR